MSLRRGGGDGDIATPSVASRYRDAPSRYQHGWRLWFDRHDIMAVGAPPRHANAARPTTGKPGSDMTSEVVIAHHKARGLRRGGANSSLPDFLTSTCRAQRFAPLRSEPPA